MNKIKLLAILVILLTGNISSQNVLVNNVTFQQRSDGTYFVDIYYNLTLSAAADAYITMEASSNNGSTWNLPCSSVTGAVNVYVTSGTNKHIVWNFAADNPGFFSNQSRIRITANDSRPCPAPVTYAGKTYNTILIGSQCWLKENLNIGVRINGSNNQTNNSIIEKYCYNDLESNCNTYGGLYQWNEAMQYVTTPGTQGICPPGWHIPTLAELQTLLSSVGDNGNALKAVGQGTGSGAGTNTSGFSALLAGGRSENVNFFNLGSKAYFGSSEQHTLASARFIELGQNSSFVSILNYSKYLGFSVRCLQKKNISPIQLILPNGGENWQGGSTQNITWTSSNVTNVKLEYTTNNGSSWSNIIASTPASTGSYAWTIPNTPSTQCKVRISDTSNSSDGDTSNNVFTISEFSNPCPDIPTLTYSGKTYNTILIGSQCWLKENLNIGVRINGSNNQTNNSIIEKYCYNNLESNCNTYGGLYQWNEAMQYSTVEGAQGICPPGWHIPTKTELQTLTSAVGNNGNALKAVGQGTGSGAGTNTSGFSALLAGWGIDNFFSNLDSWASFWSSSMSFEETYTIKLNDYSYQIPWSYTNINSRHSYSVRCLKD